VCAWPCMWAGVWPCVCSVCGRACLNAKVLLDDFVGKEADVEPKRGDGHTRDGALLKRAFRKRTLRQQAVAHEITAHGKINLSHDAVTPHSDAHTAQRRLRQPREAAVSSGGIESLRMRGTVGAGPLQKLPVLVVAEIRSRRAC
jgi:hypothetical protein